MNGTNNALYNHYGAYALKAKYQANLITSQLLVIGLITVTLVTSALWPKEALVTIDPGPAPRDSIIVTWTQPPPIDRELPKSGGPARPTNASAGIPLPVDDTLIDDRTIPTRDELYTIVGTDSLRPGDGPGLIDSGSFDYIPGPTELRICEIYPEIIKTVVPDYPEMARKVGLEGCVTIRALLDTLGDVREVQVAKSSGLEILDAAAKKAAWKCRYKPGVQNGRPVWVWITYPVVFELDH